MRPTEAEKLLGGYATGTLTDEERKALFTAALGHQALFDALMDEEALRELLADPAVRAQLIEALVADQQPKVVPFWRRTGVLGAAASLIVAGTAGLAYLRSPDKVPPPLKQETAKEAPAAKAAEAPAVAQPPVARAPKTAPLEKAKEVPALARSAEVAAPAPPPPMPQGKAAPAAGATVSAMQEAAPLKAQVELRRTEARDSLAKKAEAPRPAAAAVVEGVANHQADAQDRKGAAQDRTAAGMSRGVVSGVVGGVVGGVVSAPSAQSTSKAKGLGLNTVAGSPTPTWSLEVQPNGNTRVTVRATKGQQVAILRRGPAGVEVLSLQASDDRSSALVQWRGEVRLAPGDVLDLYLLNHPVADPSKLPETGPVDGFRARIHPTTK